MHDTINTISIISIIIDMQKKENQNQKPKRKKKKTEQNNIVESAIDRLLVSSQSLLFSR